MEENMSIVLDHVGIVVKDLEETIKLYGDIFGVTPWDKGITEVPGVDLRQTQLRIGKNYLELLQPVETDGPSTNRTARGLRERGEGLFHLSVFVDDFDTRIKALKEKGFNPEEEEVDDLFPGYNVRLAWLKPEETKGVWIEFVDETSLPEGFKSLK
jgi:methylmalonyl-CoA/ethylmalonyl-CoA epimerase